MQRRTLLKAGLGSVLPLMANASLAAQPAAESQLIYLSPVRRDGNLSRCQAEVWFVGRGNDFFVVTDTTAWRARAVAQGLTQTRVWVGDVGVWTRSGGKYLALPSLITQGSIVEDAVVHADLLTDFGRKYAAEWGRWGPRFKNGLADGSRVMLKYTPA